MNEPFLKKYKPKRYKDFVIDPEYINLLSTLVKMDSLNILLIGDSSCGKTSLLDATIREYYDKEYIPRDNVLYINNLQKQGLGIYFDSNEFNYNWSESEEFWDDLLDHCKNLKVILVNGGEPTLNKEHYKLLQRLIDTELNKSVFLKYHINMTNVPDKLLELWKWFPYLKVSCSIDDIGERNDYIRFPTKWEDVNKNLKRLLDNNINISITQTVGFMNYINIPEFHKHFTNLGIKDININLIHHPVFLGPSVLPDKIRDDAHYKFDEYFKGGNDQINVMIDTFSQPQNKELWEKTKLFTKSFSANLCWINLLTEGFGKTGFNLFISFNVSNGMFSNS